MKKLSLSLAEKLLALRSGEKFQASRLRNPMFEELLKENILYKSGKSRGSIQVANVVQFDFYLQNHFSITNLTEYVAVLKQEEISRCELVKVSTDSKLTRKRTFKGFLVNCYEPVKATLNESKMVISPTPGLFHFIYDFESFIPTPELTVVGIENPENFRHIEKQRHLFAHIQPLFVSRYPQSQHKDLLKWLTSIANPYLHFGDFDIAGINIYMNEFKKHLQEKASFFVPENIESLMQRFGNPERYDIQSIQFKEVEEEALVRLLGVIQKEKKGLDQEILQLDNWG